MALLADALIGDPDWLWRRWPHPVVWIGRAITMLERHANRTTYTSCHRRFLGVANLALLVAFAIGTGEILHRLILCLPYPVLVEGCLASILLAQRSLYAHVARVAEALEDNALERARRDIAMVVGRDTMNLEAPSISRAAIETTAENLCDGIVAPVVWLLAFGLPGLLAYKVINTADSMIGHLSDQYRAYGWAAARLDDLANLLPARLAGALIAGCAPVVHGHIGRSLAVMYRDAGLHRSPNAGWPESAMAGALDLALGGPRRYGAAIVDAPFLNGTASHEATPVDIRRALRVLVAACLVQGVAIAGLATLLG